MAVFSYSNPRVIHWGAGSVAHLQAELERLHADRVALVTTRSLVATVSYDGDLALMTPLDLWLSTGIRALDHAVEGFLADGEHPFNDVMALEAIRRLFDSLPRAKSAPEDAGVRTENQLAAWF